MKKTVCVLLLTLGLVACHNVKQVSTATMPSYESGFTRSLNEWGCTLCKGDSCTTLADIKTPEELAPTGVLVAVEYPIDCPTEINQKDPANKDKCDDAGKATPKLRASHCKNLYVGYSVGYTGRRT